MAGLGGLRGSKLRQSFGLGAEICHFNIIIRSVLYGKHCVSLFVLSVFHKITNSEIPFKSYISNKYKYYLLAYSQQQSPFT